jgi:hypothetical protein
LLPYVCDGPGKQYILTNDIDIPYYDEKYQRVQASALTSMACADKKMVNKLVETGNYLAVVSPRSTELEEVKTKKMLSFLADLEIEWRAVAHGSEMLLQVVKYSSKMKDSKKM